MFIHIGLFHIRRNIYASLAEELGPGFSLSVSSSVSSWNLHDIDVLEKEAAGWVPVESEDWGVGASLGGLNQENFQRGLSIANVTAN